MTGGIDREGQWRAMGLEPMRYPLTWCLLLLYLSTLFYLTLFGFQQLEPEPNFWPTRTILRCMETGVWSCLVNVGGNLVGFVPLGILPFLVFGVRPLPLTSFLLGLAVSAGIELIQGLSGSRTPDVDDLLLNSLGAWLGAFVWNGCPTWLNAIKQFKAKTNS